MTAIQCRWCTEHHQPRLLCDPAKKILDALYARGMDGNMPTIEFPAAIPAEELGMGLGPGDRLVRHLVVHAATVDLAGVARPMVILTGRDTSDEVLPKWCYAADDDGMEHLVGLVTDMAALAMRTAAGQRGG